MRGGLVRTFIFCLLASLVVPPGPASGGSSAITGRLSKRGYTIFALAADGRARVETGAGKAFRIRPPGRTVTLHLRGKDGSYRGPVVVERQGARVVLGLRPGARLGTIAVRNGYGLIRRAIPDAFIDASRWSKARGGIPVGARRFGLGGVRKKVLPRVPGDRDVDGIPDVLDIDDDGDRVLDNVDRRPRSGHQSAWHAAASTGFRLHSRLALPIWETVNVSAGSSAEDVEAGPRSLRLEISVLPGETAELDCTGLTYCSPGGSGQVFCASCVSEDGWPAFPACCDADGDGFGTLTPETPSADPFFVLAPRAPSSEIGTGDVLIQRVTSAGTETQFASALQFVFATVPALASWADTDGHGGSVSYPVAGPGQGPPGPGADGNGFVVGPGPDGDVTVELTLWRPQRRAAGTEPGSWIDIGGLTYQVGVFTDVPGEGLAAGMCPASSFAASSPELAPPSELPGGGGGLIDGAPDCPSDAGNTVRFGVNLSACLAAHGIGWTSGQELRLTLLAGSAQIDSAEQDVTFRLE